jgi:hypothetical protein
MCFSPANDLVSNHEIMDNIFSFSSPASIISYSWTSKYAKAQGDAFFRCNFKINDHLSRFFLDPIGFRSLQQRTGALISGSFALQFFHHVEYPYSDLDLYVPWENTRAVGHWLMNNGYVFRLKYGRLTFDQVWCIFNTKHRWLTLDKVLRDIKKHALRNVSSTTVSFSVGDGPYIWGGLLGAFDFFFHGSDGKILKVQLMPSLNSPVEAILQFHCSESFFGGSEIIIETSLSSQLPS